MIEALRNEGERRYPSREVGGRDSEFGGHLVRPDKGVGFIEGAEWVADLVLELHPEAEAFRRHPGWVGLVDDPNDQDPIGCPTCETEGPCATRLAIVGEHPADAPSAGGMS